MYICICNAVSEDQVRAAVKDGTVGSMQDLSGKLRVSTCCGRCRDVAQACLDAASKAALTVSTGLA